MMAAAGEAQPALEGSRVGRTCLPSCRLGVASGCRPSWMGSTGGEAAWVSSVG